jgi:hypothetical protein
VGFVLGQDDRSLGQRGDTLADTGAGAVVVGVAFGDQAGTTPAGVFA